jgi:hypothetical protein
MAGTLVTTIINILYNAMEKGCDEKNINSWHSVIINIA